MLIHSQVFVHKFIGTFHVWSCTAMPEVLFPCLSIVWMEKMLLTGGSSKPSCGIPVNLWRPIATTRTTPQPDAKDTPLALGDHFENVQSAQRQWWRNVCSKIRNQSQTRRWYHLPPRGTQVLPKITGLAPVIHCLSPVHKMRATHATSQWSWLAVTSPIEI